MPKKLTFYQALGQGPAINGHKGCAAAAAFAVDGGSHQLLAGPGFTGDVNRIIITSNIFDLFKDRYHFTVLPDDVVKAGQLPGALFETENIGNILKRCQHAGILIIGIPHAGHSHLDSPLFAVFGVDVQGVFRFFG